MSWITRGARLGWIAIAACFAVVSIAQTAAAFDIDTIPSGIANTLSVSLPAAELILCAAILASVAFALAVSRVPTTAIILMLLVVSAPLVAIGWLDWWVLAVEVMLVVGMFSSDIADKFTKSGG